MANTNIAFGGGTPSSVTVTAASTVIVPEDERSRNKFIFLRNMSSTVTIYLSVGTAALVNKGIPLFPLESYEFGRTCLPSTTIYGIANTGESALICTFVGR